MKTKLLGVVIGTLIRVVGVTLRWRLEDRSGVRECNPDEALIWMFWHNRVFAAPLMYRKFLRKRSGAVLTSPSGDGDILTQVMAGFGVEAVRGSSNKRPSAALREMVKWLRTGGDMVITPDGPRGPVYHLQPGVVKVAQLSGLRVLPIRMVYSKAITLKTWDRFQIPLPFSRVDVYLDELMSVPKTDSDEAFEAERLKLERQLQPDLDQNP